MTVRRVPGIENEVWMGVGVHETTLVLCSAMAVMLYKPNCKHKIIHRDKQMGLVHEQVRKSGLYAKFANFEVNPTDLYGE